ncbi:hypothetical protein P1P91_10870 [Halomonas piscis]|uniref:DUF4282 domain-containing protein n=1 Tax=Halomonas piscis TaxID=3031727 RepID=A0ABY9YZ57_9GAMM|nr:hypothetical protein [Halomonas piscis]WNK19354.1 hypothetical protein P1P91_10870 [Halomonas piscis]
MKDFQVSSIIGLMRRTSPFLIFRFLIYFGITLGYVLATGAGASVGYTAGAVFGDTGTGATWGGFIGFGLAGAVMYFLREYLLYMVKAGHIAVLVKLMDGSQIPDGRSQIGYAQGVVKERFAESNVLFGVDQLIKGVIKVFNRAFFTLAAVIPIPGIEGVAKLMNTFIRLSLTYLDEVILAYNIRTRSDNPWASSRTALILYAQNYKAFFLNAVILTFIIWGLTLGVFLLILAPIAGLVALFPDLAGSFALLIALAFAWGVKQAVIEPFAMTALMQVFFKITQDQQPDPEWEQKLGAISNQFGELKSKAKEWGHSRQEQEVEGKNTVP